MFFISKVTTYISLAFYTIFVLPGMASADGGDVITVQLRNPIGANSIQDFIASILHIVVQIGIPVAVLFIIYSGFLFVTAQGDEAKITKAKSSLWWAIIGTAVLLGAEVIADAIGGTIDNLR